MFFPVLPSMYGGNQLVSLSLSTHIPSSFHWGSSYFHLTRLSWLFTWFSWNALNCHLFIPDLYWTSLNFHQVFSCFLSPYSSIYLREVVEDFSCQSILVYSSEMPTKLHASLTYRVWDLLYLSVFIFIFPLPPYTIVSFFRFTDFSSVFEILLTIFLVFSSLALPFLLSVQYQTFWLYSRSLVSYLCFVGDRRSLYLFYTNLNGDSISLVLPSFTSLKSVLLNPVYKVFINITSVIVIF